MKKTILLLALVLPVTAMSANFTIEHVDFNRFKKLMDERYEESVTHHKKMEKKTEDEIRGLHGSCSCSNPSKCPGVMFGAPYIYGRNGVERAENNAKIRRQLYEDVDKLAAKSSEYSGIVAFKDNKSEALFLISKTKDLILLRSNFSDAKDTVDIFKTLRKTHEGDIFIYTGFDQALVEKCTGAKAIKMPTDLVPKNDVSVDRKLYRLEFAQE